MQIFCTDRFPLPLPEGHHFPIAKYALLRRRLVALKRADTIFHEAPLASVQELGRAHEPAYVRKVLEGTLSAEEIRTLGFPWSTGLVERSLRSVGATLAAARVAIADGCALSLAGGTHHASRDRGAGYCVFNDAAVAARTLQAEGSAVRVMIIDCDVHQGDGTARIFADDTSVFTLSLHGARNYPFRKAESDLDVGLPDATGDTEYLAALAAALDRASSRFIPDAVIYLAGADPFAGDQLGRLDLSFAGLVERDRMVLEICRQRRWPVAICMAGGYADPIDDSVTAHLNTVRLALDLFATDAAALPEVGIRA